MPRSSRSRPAPAAPSQTRRTHTAAVPMASNAHPASSPPVTSAATNTTSNAPGLFSQMAATAGGVAVGSTIGHGLSSMLFGSSPQSAPPVEQPVSQAQQPYAQQHQISCEVQAKEFTKCLENTDLQSCSWYLQQLKACQQAASPY